MVTLTIHVAASAIAIMAVGVTAYYKVGKALAERITEKRVIRSISRKEKS
ncbi:MAG: hypothetical protein ACR2HX_24130 [Pyrinomonadaceae bacterium]